MSSASQSFVRTTYSTYLFFMSSHDSGHTVSYQVFWLNEWMNHLRWLGRKGGYVWYLSKVSKVLIKNDLMTIWGQQEHKESPSSGVPTSALTRRTRPVHRSQLCIRAHSRRSQLPLRQDTDITAWQFCAACRLTRVSVDTARWWEVLWQCLKQLEPKTTSRSLI